MAARINTLEDLHFSEKNPIVFLRLDLNVPLKDGKITDDTRIKSAIPTLKWLLEKEAKVIACSHLGRPKGAGYEEKFSLAPVGERLAELLGMEVVLAQDYLDDGLSKMVKDLSEGQMVLLENLRFYKEEQEGNVAFAKSLAKHAQYYVNDAFGTCHRADASMVAVAECFPPRKKSSRFFD